MSASITAGDPRFAVMQKIDTHGYFVDLNVCCTLDNKIKNNLKSHPPAEIRTCMWIMGISPYLAEEQCCQAILQHLGTVMLQSLT